MGFLRFMFLRHRLAALCLAAALAGLVWFAAGFVREALYFADPDHQRQELAMWMTPRYVAKSWDLPPEVIIGIMELGPEHRGRTTLSEVTENLGITLDQLQDRIAFARAEIDLRHLLDLPPGPPEGRADD